MPATARAVDRFLASERLAVIGVSRNPADFSRKVFERLRESGYQ